MSEVASPFDLTGRTAVVTGASRGIGYALAEGLLRAGANLVAWQRGPVAAELERFAAERGVHLTHQQVDLSSEESIADAAAATLAEHRVDIVVNNAGTQIRHDAVEFPLTDFDAVMDLNLRAVFQICQAFAGPMLERGAGKIVNLASMLSYQGGLRVPAYAASKGAVTQLTKALCNEWASRGVNVNAVAPGYVTTDMNEGLLADPERSEQISVRIPAGRWGRAEDMVGAVVFLASPASDYVHGTTIPVDGGWLSR